MPPPSTFDIVIPSAGFGDLRHCVHCASEHADLDHRIILVLNGSIMNPLISGALVIQTPEPLGFEKAVNVGLAVSTAPYVVLLNDDAFVMTKGWLGRFQEAFEENPFLGAVSGGTGDGGTEVAGGGSCWWGVALRREMIVEVGYFDERFNMGKNRSDADYQRRLCEAGWVARVHTGVWIDHPMRSRTTSALHCHDNTEIYKEKWGEL